MVTRSQVNLFKDTCSFHLVEKILDLWERILVLNGHFIQGSVIHAHPLCFIFLLYEQHRCPQGDKLGQTNPFDCNSTICFFNSASSFTSILYDLLEIGGVLGSKLSYPVFMPKPSTRGMHDPRSIVPHIWTKSVHR
jgi:hypothetical protein